ncbi:hypothetical protein HC928_10260 [bacterium]|nr:hypothetical protein [bacterium]
MSTTYTTTELDTLRKPPMATGLAIAIADGGFVSTAIEFAAMVKKVRGATQAYPRNSIIQAAFGKDSHYDPPETQAGNIQSADLVEQAIERIDAALAIVTDKASDAEIAEYKQFIYDCGVAAAEAAGKGPFGRGSKKVSEAEAIVLKTIKETLGIETD